MNQRRRTILAAILGIAGLVALMPVWSWLMLAIWSAALARPMMNRMQRLAGGHGRAAAIVTVALVMMIAVPVAGLVLLAAEQAIELAKLVATSASGRQMLQHVVGTGSSMDFSTWIRRGPDPKAVVELARLYGAQVWGALVSVSGTAARVVVGCVMYVWGTYAVLAEGPRIYAWVERQRLLEPTELRRFSDAFLETGRGVLIGQGATGLIQAVLATVTYAILGVPRALFLGALTLLASLIPGLGSGLVWVPIAIGLLLTGSTVKAIILFAVGLLVIGTIDNILRPFVARHAKLKLPSLLLFASMIGGFALFGPFGLLLGPLCVRLGLEAIEIRAEGAQKPLIVLRGRGSVVPDEPPPPAPTVTPSETRGTA